MFVTVSCYSCIIDSVLYVVSDLITFCVGCVAGSVSHCVTAFNQVALSIFELRPFYLKGFVLPPECGSTLLVPWRGHDTGSSVH